MFCEVHIKFTLEQATRPRGEGDVSIYSFFNLSARWGWEVNTTPQPLYSPPRKTQYPLYPLYRRLGGLQGKSGQVQKILPLPGFDPRTIQPIVSCFTDYAILAHNVWWRLKIMKLLIIGSSPHLTFCLLGQNIVDTYYRCWMCIRLGLQDQVPHLHKITGKILGLYSLIFPILNLLLNLVHECIFDSWLILHILQLSYIFGDITYYYVEYFDFSQLFSDILTVHILYFLYIHIKTYIFNKCNLMCVKILVLWDIATCHWGYSSPSVLKDHSIFILLDCLALSMNMLWFTKTSGTITPNNEE